MPLYEYLCDKCGSKFELIEKFSAEPKTVHEGECGGAVHRLISAPAFHLKGTGWYATDYAKKGASSAATEAKKANTTESKESKSSESTPASTTTSAPAAPASSPSADSSKS